MSELLDIEVGKVIEYPFGSLQMVKEVLQFEHDPILIEYRDEIDRTVIAYWVDFNSETRRWMYKVIPYATLNEYYQNRVSLNSLFTQDVDIPIYIVDDNNTEMAIAIKVDEIPKPYLPSNESYFIYEHRTA